MKALLLSPYPPDLLKPMFDAIEATGDEYYHDSGDFEYREGIGRTEGVFDVIMLYGHRKILTADDMKGENIINMHISLLPWNKGACPNLFSWYDGTPKGVTIHQVTEKVDKGPILFQREVEFRPTIETLKTSYDKLQSAIIRLFCDYWWRLRKPELWVAFPQDERYGGSVHTTRECNDLMRHFPKQFDTPVTDVVNFGRHMRVAHPIISKRREALREMAKK